MNTNMLGLNFWLGDVAISIIFEPRDFWIGFQWDIDEQESDGDTINVYTIHLCLLPTLSIRFMWIVLP